MLSGFELYPRWVPLRHVATYKTGQRAILRARILAGHGHRTVIPAIK